MYISGPRHETDDLIFDPQTHNADIKQQMKLTRKTFLLLLLSMEPQICITRIF